MAIHAFGDSHVHYLFSLCPDVTIHWMGPWTMHRVARDGTLFFVHIAQPKPDDTILFLFGEIDARCHLIRLAEATQVPVETMVDDLACRYLAAIRETRDKVEFPLRICVLGTVPQMDAIVPNPTTPTWGSLRERTAVRALLNAALRRECMTVGYEYIEIPASYEAADGSLKMRLSDGHAHIAKDHAHHACAAIGLALGITLTFDRPSPFERVRRALSRYRATQKRDAATLWALGKLGGDPRF